MSADTEAEAADTAAVAHSPVQRHIAVVVADTAVAEAAAPVAAAAVGSSLPDMLLAADSAD
ncbi:MAG: hypothetical protein PHG48_06650, partial [Eubacteriales bacterium]|nr:hypothetical protein [Eubacteriales bacterium]